MKNTPVVPISGWMSDNLDFIANNTPVLPISGSMSDNLLKKSEDIGLVEGHESLLWTLGSSNVDTFYDVVGQGP